TGTTGATLSGCSGTLSNGVTSFSGCKIDKAGAGYVLTASDGTRSVDMAAFTVSVGPVTQLAFTTQPDGAATGGVAFPQQPVVTARDAGGNTVTSYAGLLSPSLNRATGTSGAVLSGCSGTLSNGVTSFSGCKIDKSGAGYVLTASDGTRSVDWAAFGVSNVSARSVVEATGPSHTVTTASITPVSGATYLIFIYCSGQSANCNGTSAQATVSSPAFSSVTFDEGVGTGTSKDCLEVLIATGTTMSGAVTATGASGQNIGFVNV